MSVSFGRHMVKDLDNHGPVSVASAGDSNTLFVPISSQEYNKDKGKGASGKGGRTCHSPGW